MTDYSSYDSKIGKLQSNRKYEAVYVSSAEEELKEKVQQLEKDLNYVRGMLIDLYNKCPKTKAEKDGSKDTSIECENCGGVLW